MVPPANQRLPQQERGLRHARAIPYELHANGKADFANDSFQISLANTGRAGACFHVRSGNSAEGPWTFTVEAGKSLSYAWSVGQNQSTYDLSVFGPNGFLRSFQGSVSGSAKANIDVECRYGGGDREIDLLLTNRGGAPCRITVENLYDGEVISRPLPPGQMVKKHWDLSSTFGWYDFSIEVESDRSFARRLAGHAETGQDSVSDPAFGS